MKKVLLKKVRLKKLFARFFKRAALLALLPVLLSCADSEKPEGEASPLPIRMVPVTTREIAEEVKGFGFLSYLKKFELLSPLDGILETLNFREGDMIRKGDVAGILKNPQVTLAARRAENAHSQARSALDLGMARLRDGEFQTEARILSNEKSREELDQAKKILKRKRGKAKTGKPFTRQAALAMRQYAKTGFAWPLRKARFCSWKRSWKYAGLDCAGKILPRRVFACPTGKSS